MIFIINDTQPVYLPFYSFNGHEYRSPAYVTFLTLELFLSVLSAFVTLRVCWIVWKVRVFQINLTIISNFYFLQFAEVFVGKGMMVAWQYGFFMIPGVLKSHHYLSWASPEPSNTPPIRRFADAWPMLIGSFLILHYMIQMVFFIFFYCLERVIATLLLGSYEKFSRSYISISILITASFVTLAITYSLFVVQIDFFASVLICSAVVIVSVVMYLTILMVNLKISRNFKNYHGRNQKKFDKYSLAYRFQLEENLKAFQLVRKVIVSIGVYIFINIIIIFLININILSASCNLILVFIVENCIYLNPLLICTVTVNSVEPWRCAFWRPINNLSRVGSEKSVIDMETVEVATIHRKETEIYFRDLKVLWA